MTARTFKILPDVDEKSSPSRLIPKGCFTTAETDETTMPFHHADDGSVSAGVWECPPCKMEIPAYPVNEMMTIISGALTIIHADGVSETVEPGEVVFGAKCSKMPFNLHNRHRHEPTTST